MSLDAQTSRNANEDAQQGSQSDPERQTRSVGTETASIQQLLAPNQQLLAEMKDMKNSMLAIQLESPKMEARLKDHITSSNKELTKEASKNKEDLTKEASKNKEDLTKLVTDTEGRLKDLIIGGNQELKALITSSIRELTKEASKNKEDLAKEASKHKEDLTKLVTDTEGRLNKEITKVAISWAKIFGGVGALGTLGAAILGILYRFRSFFEK